MEGMHTVSVMTSQHVIPAKGRDPPSLEMTLCIGFLAK